MSNFRVTLRACLSMDFLSGWNKKSLNPTFYSIQREISLAKKRISAGSEKGGVAETNMGYVI